MYRRFLICLLSAAAIPLFGCQTAHQQPVEQITADLSPPPPPPPYCPPPRFSNILFEFGEAALTDQGKFELNRWVAELLPEMQAHPADTLTLVGHTDDVGDAASNEALGKRRAEAVADHLTAHGFDPARLQTLSRGESDPAVSNESENNRRLNRRVVMEYRLGER